MDYAKTCEDALDQFISARYRVKRETYKYAIFDWTGEANVELKTRYNYNFTAFEWLTANDIKINYAKRSNKPTYFLYWFKNGDLYEWVFDPKQNMERITNGDPRREGHIKERPHINRGWMTKIANIPLPSEKCYI